MSDTAKTLMGTLGALGTLRKEMGYPGPAEKVLAAREAGA